MTYTKVLKLFDSADIVVCGGGTAGVFVALAAAEKCQNVLIVEQFGSLGGTATNGLVTPIMSSHMSGNPACSYLTKKLAERMKEKGTATRQNGSNFDPLALKLELEEMCMEAGVKILYHTFIADVIKDGNTVKAIVVANKAGLTLIEGKIFIDATGDGDVSVLAGAKYGKGNPETGKNQPVSLRYIVGGIDKQTFANFTAEHIAQNKVSDGQTNPDSTNYYSAVTNNGAWALSDLFDEAIAKGELVYEDKCYWQVFSLPNRNDTLAFNNPEFFDEVDATDPVQMSHIQSLGKVAIARQLRFYKKYFKGFENAYISEIASMVGVRESRNIVCDHVITAEELLQKSKFDDAISQSNYPVDIHGKQLTLKYVPPVDDKPYYEIPYRSLVVKGIDNLMVVGRCLGAEFLAESSLRVQLSVRSSGEAAGIAASMALSEGKNIHALDGAEVRREMQRLGADFVNR